MSFDAEALRNALAAHGRVARVVIAAHQGSSPREAGASMLVWEGGQSGTIGGGALELDAARQALSVATSRVTRVPLGPALGQCCGGAVTLVTEVFEDMPELGDSYARRVEGNTEEPLAVTRAQADGRNGSGVGMVFERGWLCEPVQPARVPLWVWGAGHVGRAIVDVIAPTQAFKITWIDSGADRFPDRSDAKNSFVINELTAVNIPDAVPHAPRDAHHLILTYSHAFDLDLCHRLLGHGFASAGLIGSATKWARFRSRLRALGHSEARISCIRCPIGNRRWGNTRKPLRWAWLLSYC
ncbi:XdhC protein (assists in molybdopterin insertion into xanthine dehydrogenase) [Litoreibacter arenae DSM 19593]|uniref:XdhC protein (Assists in molybdopterin insertion into xanthine dehydrogenase) n=1 Tax=Litoreibacter arenae DSM 19593 TaxID=1123360 RepID=S9QJ45_9RHOB|nr:XdhC protein (assists in molybdopterin insertion into xanthine dehydrogenase) [Litoreibacter arenae DSM 19593]